MVEEGKHNHYLSKAMALCSQREYCVADIISKLTKWGVDKHDIEVIIKALKADNFIDESRYAKAFVNDKFKYNGWGRIKISSQLRAKGLPENIIIHALDSIDGESYYAKVKSLLAARKKSIKAKDQYELNGKLARYCLSKGFESNIVFDILKIDEL